MTSFLTFTDEALLAEASRKEDHQVSILNLGQSLAFCQWPKVLRP